MTLTQSSKKSTLKIALWVMLLLFLFLFIAGWIYLRLNTYSANAQALESLVSSDEIVVTQDNHLIAFDPEKKESTSGFIIYPGGLVEPEAYALLCHLISENFDPCFIPSMPLNFAIFNSNKAQEIIEAHPEITHWTLIGHSLGGPAATRFIQSHPTAIENLILLGSYSDVNIADLPVRVVSLLGDKDGLVDAKTYKTSQVNLPPDATFVVIEGGNHSQMGDYGLQKGDGTASISSLEQKKKILEALKSLDPS